jgi:hypothetical protein
VAVVVMVMPVVIMMFVTMFMVVLMMVFVMFMYVFHNAVFVFFPFAKLPTFADMAPSPIMVNAIRHRRRLPMVPD